MALNPIEEILKKLGINLGSKPDPTALPAGSKAPLEQVMSGNEQAEPTHRRTILNAFMPEKTEDESAARRRALLQMGAQMMASSGPSYEPKNLFSIAGQGLAAGIQGYDSSIESSQKQLLSGAKIAANNADIRKQEIYRNLAKKLGGKIPTGDALNGMSNDELRMIYLAHVEAGDTDEANKILAHAQKLNEHAASKGMTMGPDGKYIVAPGYAEGLEATSRAEDDGKYTADRKNYDLYVEQATAKGETPVDFNTWQKEQKAASSTKVNVNTGQNSSKYSEKSDEEAAKRHSQIIEDAKSAPQMAGDMDMLLDLSRAMETGKWAEFKLKVGPYAEALGVDVGNLGNAQAFDAIINRLVPNMRPAGSGAMSDFDAMMFLKSLPNIGNTSDGNEIIAVTMRAVQENKLQAAEIARRAQKGDITWQDADKEMAALPNPYERFKEYKEAKVAEGVDITRRIKEAQEEQKAYDERKAKGEDTGSVDESSLPRVATKEEQDALPSGTLYIAPDGSKRRKK